MAKLLYSVAPNSLNRIRLSLSAPQFGMFFDGTNNDYKYDCRYADDDFSPTNIRKLYELYQSDIVAFIDKHYEPGVGTEAADGGHSDADGAVAYTFGKRLQRAIDETGRHFRHFSHARVGVIDVFGFSRGAAAARAYVNEVHRTTLVDPQFWGGLKPEFRFVGLFDTVGSIGIAGDDDNDNPLLHVGVNLTGPIILDVHPNAVKNVVHLTAADEIREYFPLSSIKPRNALQPPHFIEEIWPGAHADIGGGYGPGPQIIRFPEVVLPLSLDRVNEEDIKQKAKAMTEKSFPDQGRLRGRVVSIDRLKETLPEEGFVTAFPVWEREVRTELSNITLERMHQFAVKSEVPLRALDELGTTVPYPCGNLTYSVPSELRELVASVRQIIEATPDYDMLYTNSPEYDLLYRRYIHHSHQYDSLFINPNKVEAHPVSVAPNRERGIFFNEPSRGINPDGNVEDYEIYIESDDEDVFQF